MNALIAQLKQADQDFEFYPTTEEIIARLISDIEARRYDLKYGRRDFGAVLDIGAGSGKVLRALKERAGFGKLFAIEKSAILCNRLPADVFIVGTEFKEQSLLSKKADLIFCNPPYSEFVEWTVKIIRESSAIFCYLVLPTRWADSEEIQAAIKYRDAEATIVGTFSFIDAEDRAAQAEVNLVRVAMRTDRDDAFNRFFAEEFAEMKAKFDDGAQANDPGKPTAPARFSGLVPGVNYPERLVALYNKEIDHIRKNYDLVSQLDVALLKEFDVTPGRVLECLKARLAGLKNDFWSELFSQMTQVTDRLVSTKRRAILETLAANGHVDFTVSNIHVVVLWVLKNSNQSIDGQLVEVFDRMVGKANVRNYRSNQRAFVHDRWRYQEEKPTHIALEYRLVLQNIGGINTSPYQSEGSGLDDSANEFIQDLMTVAGNLGFVCDTTDSRLQRRGARCWASGTKHEFEFRSGTNPPETLLEVRAYQNGNVHIRMNQKFALALNVEVGRLRGWLNSGAEAAAEIGDKNAPLYFGKNAHLGQHSLPMLTGGGGNNSDNGRCISSQQ